MGQIEDWSGFWKSREVTSYRDTVWRMNMEYFVRATGPVMDYSEDDAVLDIGCGAGYLSELLHERVSEVHGVDISERYLETCRRKLSGASNCHFHQLDDEAYTDLGFLPSGRFNKIVCLSVIQYYEQPSDVERLIQSVRTVAAPGARFLISDIPTGASTGSDVTSLLALAWRERHLVDTLRYLAKMRLSEYHSVRARNGVIQFPQADLEDMSQRLGLDAEILTDQLTVNRSRLHWLITF